MNVLQHGTWRAHGSVECQSDITVITYGQESPKTGHRARRWRLATPEVVRATAFDMIGYVGLRVCCKRKRLQRRGIKRHEGQTANGKNEKVAVRQTASGSRPISHTRDPGAPHASHDVTSTRFCKRFADGISGFGANAPLTAATAAEHAAEYRTIWPLSHAQQFCKPFANGKIAP